MSEILKFMGTLGWRYYESELYHIKEYLQKMVWDGRLFEIKDGEETVGIMAYGLCHDPSPFLKKGDWEYLAHDPSGTCLFVEHLASPKFSFKMLRFIEETFVSRYPQIWGACWKRYHPNKDKVFIMKRRNYV